jgi:polyisoprenyl-teichoic acid--peptidoglycan teichoic acid transferase
MRPDHFDPATADGTVQSQKREQRFSARARLHSFGLLLAGALLPVAKPKLAAAQEGVEPVEFRRPITLLAGGLDTRVPDEPENTDVIMLARVDVPNATVRAISIPRDLFLEIPGFGFDKITRAYDFGSKSNGGSFKSGAQLVRETITWNFGIEMDGVVFTTFDGYVQIVDALGGVDVENPYDLYDAEYPTRDYGYKEIYYPAGWIHLDGEQALEFSRSRHQDGDDGRVMRQQLVIRALLERARDPEIAAVLPEIMVENMGAVRTDLGPSKRLALALAAPEFTNDGVTFSSLNGLVYPDSTSSGMWIYSGDWSQIPGYVDGFLSGAL